MSKRGCPYLVKRWQWVIAGCLMVPAALMGLVVGWNITFGGFVPPISECTGGQVFGGFMILLCGVAEGCAMAGVLAAALVYHAIGGPIWLIAQAIGRSKPPVERGK